MNYYYPTLSINRQARKVLLRQGAQILQADDDAGIARAAFFPFFFPK